MPKPIRAAEARTTYIRPPNGGSPGLRFGVVRLTTLDAAGRSLTSASGFFFERAERLYIVTSRHVVFDGSIGHAPSSIEVPVHTDRHDMTRHLTLRVPLYEAGRATWRQAEDSGGDIDVAVIPLPAEPAGEPFYASPFTASQIPAMGDAPGIGESLLIPGFPLGFFDTVYQLPVARHAIVASEYGVRFQGKGYFLTDSRTHSGSSGAPVLQRVQELSGQAGWRLVGVHSSRIDMATRNPAVDESLGLNCAWYPDVLLALTQAAAPPVAAAIR